MKSLEHQWFKICDKERKNSAKSDLNLQQTADSILGINSFYPIIPPSLNKKRNQKVTLALSSNLS
jgi:hypothetical protein